MKHKETAKRVGQALRELDNIYSDLGKILILLGKSQYHSQRYSAGATLAYVMPALQTKSYKIFYNKLMPIAYVSWAFLSPDLSKKYEKGDYALRAADYRAGNEPWIVDFVVPYDDDSNHHQDKVIDELKKGQFSDQQVKSILRNDDGSIKRIVTMHGDNFISEIKGGQS